MKKVGCRLMGKRVHYNVIKFDGLKQIFISNDVLLIIL